MVPQIYDPALVLLLLIQDWQMLADKGRMRISRMEHNNIERENSQERYNHTYPDTHTYELEN